MLSLFPFLGSIMPIILMYVTSVIYHFIGPGAVQVSSQIIKKCHCTCTECSMLICNIKLVSEIQHNDSIFIPFAFNRLCYILMFSYTYMHPSTGSHAVISIWLVQMYTFDYNIKRKSFTHLASVITNPACWISLNRISGKTW